PASTPRCCARAGSRSATWRAWCSPQPASARAGQSRRRRPDAQALALTFTVVAAVSELPPVRFRYVDVVAFRGGQDPLPRLVALRIADPFDLVEAGDRVAHVPRVRQRLLALLGEGELLVRQFVLLRGAQAFALTRDILAVRPVTLRVPGLDDVAPGRFLLPVGRHDAPFSRWSRPTADAYPAKPAPCLP